MVLRLSGSEKFLRCMTAQITGHGTSFSSHVSPITHHATCFTTSPLISCNSSLNDTGFSATLLKPALNGLFRRKLNKMKTKNNLVAQVSRLAGARASLAEAQRLVALLLLRLAGLEACVTPLRLIPVRAMPTASRRYGRLQICATSALRPRNTLR